MLLGVSIIDLPQFEEAKEPPLAGMKRSGGSELCATDGKVARILCI